MKILRITGRCIADPPPAGWREQLAAQLGGKPRRIGIWAELGLYGALQCMADAGEKKLPVQAGLILSSQHGPVKAMWSVLEQACEDLPMPLTFLQTQPSQLLATLAAQLNWRGDARFITHADPRGLLCLAAVQNNRDGLLLGWVDETGVTLSHSTRLSKNDNLVAGYAASRSVWLRLMPCNEPTEKLQEFESFEMGLEQARYLRITPAQTAVLLG